MNHGQYTIADKLVELIHADFQGFHPGYRGVHSASRYYAATFTATPQAKTISRAIHLQGAPVPATVRHSHSASGNPFGPAGAPSMAVKFYLPDGTVTDLIALQLSVFPASTPEQVLQILEVVRPTIPDGPTNKENLAAFLATRPAIARAIAALEAVQPPLSLAQTSFHPLHAFRFVNAAGEMQYARYHWQPVAGEAFQTKDELLGRPPTYLYEELEARLRVAPVMFELFLQLAGEGDSTVDICAFWPEDRPRVKIGDLEVRRPTTIEEIGDPVMLHDPTRLTDGIEASDDPILAARRGVYEVSVAHRTGGWKGRQAAWERAGVCPFG